MAKNVSPAGLTYGAMKVDGAPQSGTSIFDPVLCELAYRWFCPPGGAVLDPFAGGSVRGIVASKLGRPYLGIDLREEQIVANEVQADRICAGDPHPPAWRVGDSRNVLEIAAEFGGEFDFVFSCPPYADLEVYSDNPLDLSTMDYPAFLDAYEEIIAKSCSMLKPNRFACFVVGEARDAKGSYYGFVPDTVKAFQKAGVAYYNEGILITAAGSLATRAGKQFETSRKLGKTHQNILVFVKGDARVATSAVGLCEFGAIDGEEAGQDPTDSERPEPIAEELTAPTPIERHGDVWLKRDDTFTMAGVSGGKVRTCWHLASRAVDAGAEGLVTAGARASPQINIVAHIAQALGVPCRAHTPSGELGDEVAAAQAVGCEIVQHKAGYNNVIVARAREDAKARGWAEIPFGMECREAVEMTATQIAGIPADVKRIVVPVGSGMSLAGVLHGLAERCPVAVARGLRVLGVVVGADPIKRLDKYAPPNWRDLCTLVPAGVDYHTPVEADVDGVKLDPIYEAKCSRFLEPGDLLWCVGLREVL